MHILKAEYWSRPMIVDNIVCTVILLYSWTENFGQSAIASPERPSGFSMK